VKRRVEVADSSAISELSGHRDVEGHTEVARHSIETQPRSSLLETRAIREKPAASLCRAL
jgi:hypothetical protein